jgi:hypothetical protein
MRPLRCQNGCGHFFLGNRDTVVLKWLEDGHGRVLWYLYLCVPCWRTLPDHVRGRAIEPPDRDVRGWHGFEARSARAPLRVPVAPMR